MNVVLIGYRCSGKTAVSEILSGELGMGCRDTDTLIEEFAGSSIDSIISEYGWDHFREIEKKVIKEISGKDNLIIATGGGVVMDKKNVINLKKNGWMVWLKASPEILERRMVSDLKSGNIRPSLTGVDPLEEIKQVLTARIPLYENATDFIVDTDSLTVREVVLGIMREMQENLKK